MENLEALVKALKSHTPQGVTLLEYEPMSRHTSFRIGGPVRLMAVAHGDVAGVAALLAEAHKQGVIPLLIGNGSDLLAPDQGMDALVVKTTASDLKVEGNTITARSGALLSQLASYALDHGLTGLEFAHGIPGTVGGGVTMNAGAYGGELGRRVTEVLWLDRAGEEQVSQNADCRFD
ncbi:MAG: FAD-binding protein, partial [Oscillibacter sp.]